MRLRQDVVKALFSATPVDEDVNQPVETELTRAARRSVDNADKIIEAEELHEDDFLSVSDNAASFTEVKATKKHTTNKDRKKARKAERKRRAKGRKR